MKAIINGYEIQIDPEEVWRILKYKYYKDIRRGKIYFQRQENQKRYTLSREIMNTPYGMECDHKNGDGLNCLKSNMRNCTHADNNKNKKLYRTNKIGLKGVSWFKPVKKWRAQIQINKKVIYLGSFEKPEDAHDAYCEAAKKYHGEFARFA